MQQLREILARTLKLPTTTELEGDAAFPEPEANQLIGWNGTGTGLVNLSVLSEGDLLVSSFIETLLNDVDADEARGTLGAVGLTGNETITGNKTFSGQASGFGIPVVKRKTADESVTSSDVLQDDDHLTFAIAANEEWVASFEITCGDLLSTTGVKAAITTPAGATQRIFSMHETNAGDAVGSGSTTTSGAAIVSSTPAAGTQTFIRISLWVLNGATPGNVTLQWAQVNTSGTALTFKKGSHMIAHRIA